jgi:hypothetical protein
MSASTRKRLTDIANRAAAVADALLYDRRPRDWSTCPRVAAVVRVGKRLQAAYRMVPSAIAEVQRRADTAAG